MNILVFQNFRPFVLGAAKVNNSKIGASQKSFISNTCNTRRNSDAYNIIPTIESFFVNTYNGISLRGNQRNAHINILASTF